MLSTQEETLITIVRRLQHEQADKILVWAAQLRDLAGDREIDWSDHWSNEDLSDAVAASVRRLETEEQKGS